jgi:hypothetical protein
MEAGFVADRGHYSVPDVPNWVEGEPQKSFWRGLDTRNRAVFPVSSYRCEKCGYLEHYARAAEST